MRPAALTFIAFVSVSCAVGNSPALQRLSVVQTAKHAQAEQRAVLEIHGAPHIVFFFPTVSVTRWIYCHPRKKSLIIDFDSQGRILLQIKAEGVSECWEGWMLPEIFIQDWRLVVLRHRATGGPCV